MDLKEQLIRGLEAIRADPNDELAYYALTSKPEFQVRDRLAYWLHQTLRNVDPDLQVVREWKRVDLAILRRGEPEPIALIEAKAMTTYNVTRPRDQARYREGVLRDIRAAGERAPDAAIYALVMVTHVDGEIPADLHGVVKYSKRLNNARRLKEVTVDEIDDLLDLFLPEVGTPERVRLGKGAAFGSTAEVTAWLFGPVKANQIPR